MLWDRVKCEGCGGGGGGDAGYCDPCFGRGMLFVPRAGVTMAQLEAERTRRVRGALEADRAYFRAELERAEADLAISYAKRGRALESAA